MVELASPLATFLRGYLPRDRDTSRHTVFLYVVEDNATIWRDRTRTSKTRLGVCGQSHYNSKVDPVRAARKKGA